MNAVVMIVNGIVLVPLYFKFMSISAYGAWLATGNVVGVFGLMEMGLASVITQKMSFALANKDNTEFMKLASANVYTAIILSISVFVLGLTISPFVANWIHVSNDIKESITIAYIIALFSASITIMVSLYGAFPQVWQETKTIGIINSVVNLLGIASLVVYLYSGFGVVSLALGYVTRALLNLIGQGFWVFIKWKKLKLGRPEFNFIIITMLLKDSLYPFLSKLSNMLTGNSTSFIIASFFNPALAAIYDITSKIVVVACNFINIVNGSFFALFAITFGSKDKLKINNLIKRVSFIFLTILIFAILFSMVFTKPIVYFWVGLDKYGGNSLLAFIVIATLITQLKQYFNNLLYTGGLIKKSAKLDIYSSFLYLVLLFSLIKMLRIYTIPLANIIAGLIFIGFYLRLLFTKLQVDIRFIINIIFKSAIATIPILLIHFLLNVNLMKFSNLIICGFLVTVSYAILITFTNKAYLYPVLKRVKLKLIHRSEKNL